MDWIFVYNSECSLCLWGPPDSRTDATPSPAGQSTPLTHLSLLSYININTQTDKFPRCSGGKTREGNEITVLWCESVQFDQWRTEGGLGCSNPPPKFRRPSKIVPNSTWLWKLLKIAEFRTPTPQDVRKKGSKILKLPRFAIVLH